MITTLTPYIIGRMEDKKQNELENKFNELLLIVKTIKNKVIRERVTDILIDKKIDIMNRAGAADRIDNDVYYPGDHHFYKGGLLCHLLETTKFAISIAETSNKDLDMDLIIAGACLHDIGKTITYDEWNDDEKLKNPFTIYADRVQHTYLSMQIFCDYIKNDIGEKEKLEILHIIASHMQSNSKTTDFGALLVPKTIEAKIVNRADSLSCMLSKYDDKS